ncbi:hypothetical protein ABPG72_009943 [Tetrahymena utriculariae]
MLSLVFSFITFLGTIFDIFRILFYYLPIFFFGISSPYVFHLQFFQWSFLIFFRLCYLTQKVLCSPLYQFLFDLQLILLREFIFLRQSERFQCFKQYILLYYFRVFTNYFYQAAQFLKSFTFFKLLLFCLNKQFFKLFYNQQMQELSFFKQLLKCSLFHSSFKQKIGFIDLLGRS